MAGIQEFDSKVLSVTDYTDEGGATVKVFLLQIPGNIDFEYKPGQFAMIGMQGFMDKNNMEKLKFGAFSIASSPNEKGVLEFCIRILTKTDGLTNHLGKNAGKGSVLRVKGPFGMFTLNENAPEFIFVATGTGIAPIMSFLRTLKNNSSDKPIHLFYGCRNSRQYIYGEEIERLEEEMSNLNYFCCASDNDPEWKGCKGFVQEGLKEHKFNNAETAEAYLCGLPAMVRDVQEILSGMGLKTIKTEKY